jgi:hypothetical protein
MNRPIAPGFRVTGHIRHSAASMSRSCCVMRSNIRVDGWIRGFGGWRIASWQARTQEENGDAVEVNVAARTGRQHILDGEGAPDLRVLLDESVLYREIGSAAVMHGQLEHMPGTARRPNVPVQLVPAAARAYLGLAGAFSIATLADGSQAAHLETGIQGMTVIDAKLVSQAAQMFDDPRDTEAHLPQEELSGQLPPRRLPFPLCELKNLRTLPERSGISPPGDHGCERCERTGRVVSDAPMKGSSKLAGTRLLLEYFACPR